MHTLDNVHPSLPSDWYYDGEHHVRELQAIWYQDWICVGRSESLQKEGDYFTIDIGSQSVIVVRQNEHEFRAYHNTCRHRGSALCGATSGRFRHGRIVCPYHAWTYSLQGELVVAPGSGEAVGFDASDFSLYPVHVDSWRGFLFVNLSQTPAKNLATFLGQQVNEVANWPLETMSSVYRETYNVACNWKIYWENYNECYHCPGVHPELCRVMPVYKKGVFDFSALPDWKPQFDGDAGLGAVGNGAKTWTIDGQPRFADIVGPTDEELARGVTFATFDYSLFLAAHPDYVRCVRLRPIGPEKTELVIDWLMPSNWKVTKSNKLTETVELGRLVMQQDCEVCEPNQRGLHSNQHDEGVLMPQEYELWHFHQKLRSRLDK